MSSALLDDIDQAIGAVDGDNQARFAALTQAVLDESIGAEDAVAELRHLGRTSADLRAAVELRRQRLGWASEIDAAASAREEIARIDQDLAARQKGLEEFVANENAKMVPLRSRKESLLAVIGTSKRAASQLRKFAPPQIVVSMDEACRKQEMIATERLRAQEYLDSVVAAMTQAENALANAEAAQRAAATSDVDRARTVHAGALERIAELDRRREQLRAEVSRLSVESLVP